MDEALVASVSQWLASQASRQIDEPAVFGDAFLDRVVAGGIPLARASTNLVTMHPEVQGIELVWWRGQGSTLRALPHGVLESEDFKGSPVDDALRAGQTVRHRLDAGPIAFPQLAALAEKGVVDYVATPVELGEGQQTCFTYATDRPGGFTDDELATLGAIFPALVQRVEVGALRRARQALLEVYLGPEAAQRVLSGAFRRGQGTLRTVVILYCDMRGFTALSDALPPAEVVSILDQYFEILGGAVADHGGEILKFIGDAMLATFPVDDRGPGAPCQAAMAAARQALGGLAALDALRQARSQPSIRVGVALHLGEVMFGNIGARNRLDFTIIGRAVNEATRIETLCKVLDVPLLVSAEFARAAHPTPFTSLGEHVLRGVRAPQEVFAPAPEDQRAPASPASS